MHSSKLLITVFLILCLIPLLLMPLIPAKAAANEVLAPSPRAGVHMLEQLSDWFSDRFAFRQEMVTAWAGINAAVFRTSAEKQVILGEDGWLYYAESLNDYAGCHLTQEELDSIARHLLRLQEEAESAGCRFLFTVAPNKNSIYTSHMPDSFPENHKESNIAMLIPYLEKYGIHYISLYDLFADHDGLYYATDSHWTAEGAARVADRLLGSSFSDGEFATGEKKKGDLYEMLYPAGRGTEQQVYYCGNLDYETLGDPKGGDAVTIKTVSDTGTGKLLCFRDSFGISLYPYLAACSEEALFTRSVSFNFEKYNPEDYDTVIVEIVERNLDYLLEN